MVAAKNKEQFGAIMRVVFRSKVRWGAFFNAFFFVVTFQPGFIVQRTKCQSAQGFWPFKAFESQVLKSKQNCFIAFLL